MRYLRPAISVLLLLAPVETIAKPKQTTYPDGCSTAQIQHPAAEACLRQMEKDLLSGAAYLHHLQCDETGVYCCQGNDTRTFGCKRVRGMSRVEGGAKGGAPVKTE